VAAIIAIMVVAVMLFVISAVAIMIALVVMIGRNDTAARYKEESRDGAVSGDALQCAHRTAPLGQHEDLEGKACGIPRRMSIGRRLERLQGRSYSSKSSPVPARAAASPSAH
jgi:hypothetical protein